MGVKSKDFCVATVATDRSNTCRVVPRWRLLRPDAVLLVLNFTLRVITEKLEDTVARDNMRKCFGENIYLASFLS